MAHYIYIVGHARKNFKVKSTPKEQLFEEFGESSCSENHTCKSNCLQVPF